MSLPLDGISVIEFGQNLAGPFSAEILGHLGADVIKVERPGSGDDARGWGPPFGHGTSAAFHSMKAVRREFTAHLRERRAVPIAGGYHRRRRLRPPPCSARAAPRPESQTPKYEHRLSG